MDFSGTKWEDAAGKDTDAVPAQKWTKARLQSFYFKMNAVRAKYASIINSSILSKNNGPKEQ